MKNILYVVSVIAVVAFLILLYRWNKCQDGCPQSGMVGKPCTPQKCSFWHGKPEDKNIISREYQLENVISTQPQSFEDGGRIAGDNVSRQNVKSKLDTPNHILCWSDQRGAQHTDKNGKLVNVNYSFKVIGNNCYRMTESVDGKPSAISFFNNRFNFYTKGIKGLSDVGSGLYYTKQYSIDSFIVGMKNAFNQYFPGLYLKITYTIT